MKKTLLLFILFITTACTTPAQQINKAKLDSLFNALATNNKCIGSMAISQNGVIVYQKATGYASINDKIPTTPNSIYRIGSISKMFTSVIVFQLIDEGKLSLTTPLSKYYPQVPNADKITIGLMLNHRTGLHNFTDSTYMTYYTKPKTHDEMVNIFVKDKPEFKPGTKTAYSNTNFVLLGYIAEKITGKPYSTLIKDRITKKLGLNNTGYGGKIDLKRNEVYSYKYVNSWEQEAETDMSIPGGAGAIAATPADLTKFIEGLFAGKLVSDSSLTVMKTLKDGFGSGMFTYNFDGKTGYGHDGGIDGFRSNLTYFPGENLAVAYCSNGGTYSINGIGIAVLSILFNKPYKIPEFKTVTLKTQELDKYLGIYASEQMPLKITVTKKEATLIAQATGQGALPLDALGDNKFAFEAAGIVLEFDPVKNEMTIKQGGRTTPFKKEK